MNADYTLINEKWKQLKSFQPELSTGSVAEKLKISEAELFYAGKGDEIKLLNSEFEKQLNEIAKFPDLNLIVKNKACVNSIKTAFKVTNDETENSIRLKSAEMDLEIPLRVLKYGFAFNSADEKSIQYFDKYGFSVFKIRLKKESLENETDDFIKTFENKSETFDFEIEAYPAEHQTDLTADELKAFQSDWKNLDEPEEFNQILKKYNISQLNALHHAPEDYFATKIRNRKVANILEEAIVAGTKLKFSVENHKTGLTYKCASERGSWHGEWFNVFGKTAQFSLDTSKIIESFIVRKPSRSGIISSISCFDGNNAQIFEVYCNREDDEPEPNEWRALLNSFEN